MKRIISFPPFYHPKDNIEFTPKDDPTIRFHLFRTVIGYNYITDSLKEFYCIAGRNNYNVDIFPQTEIIPTTNSKITSLTKEFNFPTHLYPAAKILDPRNGQLECIGPIHEITFKFGTYPNPPLEIVLTASGRNINLNTRGEIINNSRQRFIEWL